MKLTKYDENIALHLQYNNILLTKALANLVQNHAGITSFALLYDSTDQDGNMQFTLLPDPEEKIVEFNHEIKQVATVVGCRLFDEIDFDLESSLIIFNIEYEEEDDDEWEALLLVTIEEFDKSDYEMKEEFDQEDESAAIEILRTNGIEVDERLEDPEYAKSIVRKVMKRYKLKFTETEEEE